MNIEDSGEFGRRLTALAEIYDVKLSPPRAALYFEALRDLPFEALAMAMNAAAKGCKFFPRPVELRELAVGDSEDAAEAAWMAFNAAAKRIGYMGSVSVQDAALAEAIVSVFGGWSQACTQEYSPEMWASKRKEFGRAYRVLRQRRLTGGRYLAGHAERLNQGRVDWFKYVPVGKIGADGFVRLLTTEQAEDEREALAVAAHEWSRIESNAILTRMLAEHQDGAA